jgi:citrate synthase
MTSRPAQTPIRSRIASSNQHAIALHGHDLIEDLMGKVDLGELAFLLMRGRLASRSEGVMLNAMFVSLAEHGLTPSAMATRMTVAGAPEAMQAAVAAGLLGLGSVYVGSIEGAAKLVTNALAEQAGRELDEVAQSIVDRSATEGGKIPGIGHPQHTEGDPRALRLFAIAAEHGVAGLGAQMMQAIGRAASARRGRLQPVNVTGAIGALAYDLGIPWQATRGLGVIARCVGLVGHVIEESAHPIARELCRRAEAESAEAGEDHEG